MNHISFLLIIVSFLFLFHGSHSVDVSVKTSLINFLAKLTSTNGQLNHNLGWNVTSDPCKDRWPGLVCDRRNVSVTKLFLDGLSLSGTLQTSYLCNSKTIVDSLTVLSINHNNVTGEIPADIEKCKQLTRFHTKGNKLHGSLPSSLARLVNLKRLELSNNGFSGKLPELSRISGLTMFLAENNRFSGTIPRFDFSNLVYFNVSLNNFSGPIPIAAGSYFPSSSFLGNPHLCGDPLPEKCQSIKLEEVQSKDEGSKHDKNQISIYSGYIVLAGILVILVIVMLCKRKIKEKKADSTSKVVSVGDDDSNKFTSMSGEYKTSKQEFSMRSTSESGNVSSRLIVLTNPMVNGLNFEELLKAPAELIGRGNHGSLYKVIFDYGVIFAVKRIKNWAISTDEFMQRMWKIDQVKHPHVLPALAFYSSDQEKLLVYEYQPNGSLFSLLHGTNKNKKALDWTSRLEVAASIAKALAYMHKALQSDTIGHGNLKSSNILFDKNMKPCLSEYGLMEIQNQNNTNSNSFKSDIYGFGVILLELLTGKLVVDEKGVDLTEWVQSVLREEWTAEVFDQALMAEGISEERMVRLLLVALKCVEYSPSYRMSINQVTSMVNAIVEEEEGYSIVSEV